MTEERIRVEMIPKLRRVFDFTKHYRFRCAYGGRGSGKSRSFAIAAAYYGAALAASGQRGVILCAREFMNSLEDSSMAELKAVIDSDSLLSAHYDVGEKYIRTRDKRIQFVFTGLRHNLNSVKSKSRILVAWIDEAEDVSEIAWRKLLPTVREDGSEIWVTWNPEKDGSPTDNRFIKQPPNDSIIVKLNYNDNPYFPVGLERQRQDDARRLDEGTYRWIWEGEYRKQSKAQIFANRYEVAEFKHEINWTVLQGIDWGFANDPTAAIRCYVWDNKLFISDEAVKVGLELDMTVPFIKRRIPDFENYDARADNARPETIRHVQRHGLSRVTACRKGKGSVEDGIEHIKSYERIIIHPRCIETIREFKAYSYKVDRLSGEILPTPVDANNHCIDALRYALEPLMKQSSIEMDESAIELFGAF